MKKMILLLVFVIGCSNNINKTHELMEKCVNDKLIYPPKDSWGNRIKIHMFYSEVSFEQPEEYQELMYTKISSVMLQSAGPDGLFGTSDDIIKTFKCNIYCDKFVDQTKAKRSITIKK